MRILYDMRGEFKTMRKDKIKQLIKVLEDCLDEIDSYEEDMLRNRLDYNTVKEHVDCLDNNINKIEKLAIKIVNSWRRDSYSRQSALENLSINKVIDINKKR